MTKLQTLGTLSLNGKSFYFNRGHAKNGAGYLSINGTAGERRERLVVFDNQLPAFLAEMNRIGGIVLGTDVPETPFKEAPCEDCHVPVGGAWTPIIGTGIPGETCQSCGRQL